MPLGASTRLISALVLESSEPDDVRSNGPFLATANGPPVRASANPSPRASTTADADCGAVNSSCDTATAVATRSAPANRWGTTDDVPLAAKIQVSATVAPNSGQPPNNTS